MKRKSALGALALVGALAACGEGELILQGQRQDVRNAVIGGPAEDIASLAPTPGAARPIALPAPRGNAEWTHPGGNQRHDPGHVALAASLAPLWVADIGEGDSRKHRITASPVVAGGRVFTMDSVARVSAIDNAGKLLWQRDLTPAADRRGDASGGGLAYGEGRLFVTTGYGDLVALDPATGAVIWTQDFEAGAGGAPVVSGGRVYAVARDASAWAMRAADGKVEWVIPGTPSNEGVMGAAAPAADDRQVVFPFPSGQVIAVAREGGTGLWANYVAGQRRGRAQGTISDLTGDPVIAGNTVYAATSAGRMVAIDADTGRPRWFAAEGATGPVVVAGGAVFLVNDEDQMLRLDAATGQQVWRTDLPFFTKDRNKRRRTIFVHYGPVLAGGRLLLASTDGLVRSVDPASGAVSVALQMPAGAAAAPAVAGGVLYVVTKDGKLRAFR
ncbi:PQQ-like beta-propeller repeat protein [Albidovulum sp.]